MTTAAWSVEPATDGFSGRIVVNPEDTIHCDGDPVPEVTWHLPIYFVSSLATALELLTETADLFHAHTGELPTAWTPEVAALRDALDHLVATGRARRVSDVDGAWYEPVPGPRAVQEVHG